MGEQGVGEGVGFSGGGWIAGQEGEGEGSIEEVAQGEENGGGIWKGQAEKSGD